MYIAASLKGIGLRAIIIFVVPFPEFPYRGRAAVERVVILEIPAFYSPWIGLQFLSTLPEGPRP